MVNRQSCSPAANKPTSDIHSTKVFYSFNKDFYSFNKDFYSFNKDFIHSTRILFIQQRFVFIQHRYFIHTTKVFIHSTRVFYSFNKPLNILKKDTYLKNLKKRHYCSKAFPFKTLIGVKKVRFRKIVKTIFSFLRSHIHSKQVISIIH